jgi:hypothetical protein
VEKVRGNAVLVNGEELPLNVGDEFLTSSDGERKTGWIRIKNIKNNRAVAEILKGSVSVGQRLIPKATSKNRSDDSGSHGADVRDRSRGKRAWGLLLGYSMDSMKFTAGDSNVPPVHTEPASLSGSSYKLKGFYDRPWTDTFGLRLLGGLDGFNGTYSAQSAVINRNGAATSSVSVTFIALEAEIFWNIYKTQRVTYWLGAGYSFEYAMSSSTNLYSLQMNSSYTNSIFFGGGANIQISATNFIPVAIHYNYYVAGSGITQSAINLYGGYGWYFK